MKEKVNLIPLVDCRDLSNEADEWLIENDHSTHYQHDVVQLYKENGHDNIFVEWFEEKYDMILDKSKVNYIALKAT